MSSIHSGYVLRVALCTATIHKRTEELTEVQKRTLHFEGYNLNS